ncbi:MAG: glutathione synthase [Thermosynechococcaceae cyanobacterium MS004]|nr:glutathione synthase [Thermosynechococcaceae cyanobacterium MS004]
MKLAFIVDPIERLDPGHDTSVALMEAAQGQGHEVWVAQAENLQVIESKAWAFTRPITIQPVALKDGIWKAPQPWYSLGESTLIPLEQMDAVLMRKDPPVSTAYLYATYLLDYIDPNKTLVLNHPQGLRAANEKMFALQFKDAIPDTIVSQDKSVIGEFVEAKGMAVLKPLGGKAGEGILLLAAGDRNFNSLIEISTLQGQLPVMVQEYLPQAQEGDKRIILLNGEPIGAVNRIPSGKEFRGNMATGGRVAQSSLTEREQSICQQLAPTLRKFGLLFVGIDVIGGYLTEINVTSPTGIREIDRLDGVRLGDRVVEWLANTKRGYFDV